MLAGLLENIDNAQSEGVLEHKGIIKTTHLLTRNRNVFLVVFLLIDF